MQARQGIAHKDLGPQNIKLKEEDEPVILDFGMARHITEELQTQLLRSRISGKEFRQFYVPPEVDAGISTPNTDLYSLAMLWKDLLLGEFGGLTLKDYELFSINPDARALIQKNLSLEYQNRSPDAKTFLEEIAKIGNHGIVVVYRDISPEIPEGTEERPQVKISKKNPLSTALPANKYFWDNKPSEGEILRIRRHEFVREFEKVAESNSLAQRMIDGEKLEVILQGYEARRQDIDVTPSSEQRKQLQQEFNRDLEELAELIPGIERGYSLLSLEEKVKSLFKAKEGDIGAEGGRGAAFSLSLFGGALAVAIPEALDVLNVGTGIGAFLSGFSAIYTGLVTGTGKLREKSLQKNAREKATELDKRKEKAFSYIESLSEEERDRPMMDTDYGAPPVVLSRNNYDKENLHDRLQFVEKDIEERIKYGELTPEDGKTERLRRMRKLFDDTSQANESYSDLLQSLLQDPDVSDYINSLNDYRKRPVWQLWKKEIAKDQERRLGELSYLIPITEGPSPEDMATAAGMGIGLPVGGTTLGALLGLATGTFAEITSLTAGISSLIGGFVGITGYTSSSLSDNGLNYILERAREVGCRPGTIGNLESNLLSEKTQKPRENQNPDLSWLHENSS